MAPDSGVLQKRDQRHVERHGVLEAFWSTGVRAYVKSVQQWVRQGVAGGVIGELLDEAEDYNAIRKWLAGWGVQDDGVSRSKVWNGRKSRRWNHRPPSRGLIVATGVRRGRSRVTEPQGIADTHGRTDTLLEWCQDPSKGDVTEVWLTAVRQQTFRVAKFLPKGLYLSCSRGRGTSRLHKTEGCFRVPGVDFLDFEHLGSTLREVPSSSSFCHSCWQAEEPADKSGSGVSETGGDTGSDSVNDMVPISGWLKEGASMKGEGMEATLRNP